MDRSSDLCRSRSLFLNISKCSTITFTRNEFPIIFQYRIDQTTLERVDHIRDLGVILDGKLTFAYHVDGIVNSSLKNLGFLVRQCRVFESIKSIYRIYYAYVSSLLNSASVIWNPQYQIYIERIVQIQNKLLKYLSLRGNFTSSNDYVKVRFYGLLDPGSAMKRWQIVKSSFNTLAEPVNLSL